MPDPEQREILLEYTRIGNSVRVVAVDAETGTEVTFQAPLHTSSAEMQRTAVSKLKYVMGKQKQT
jgi:hypothetical protein